MTFADNDLKIIISTLRCSGLNFCFECTKEDFLTKILSMHAWSFYSFNFRLMFVRRSNQDVVSPKIDKQLSKPVQQAYPFPHVKLYFWYGLAYVKMYPGYGLAVTLARVAQPVEHLALNCEFFSCGSIIVHV